VRRSRREIQAVAGLERDVAVVGVEDDRALQAEHNLRAGVLMALVGVAGAFAHERGSKQPSRAKMASASVRSTAPFVFEAGTRYPS
jgi:hypothetical protein